MPSRRTIVCTLVALTALFLFVGPRIMGLSPFDETFYLEHATGLQLNDFITGYSPLYSFWYGLLSRICPDAITRYFLSWRILAGFVVLLPPLLSLNVRGLRGTWLYAAFFLALPILFVTPFVSIFAAAFLLAGMCLLLCERRLTLSAAGALACVLAFIVSFARPEFGYGVLLATVATGLALLAESRKMPMDSARIARALAKLAVALALAAATRAVQVRAAVSGRDGIAFMQHFNLRASEHGTLPAGEQAFFSFYAMHRFGLVQRPDQPPPGIAVYFHANPGLFLNHLRENLCDARTIALSILLAAVILWPWFSRRHRSLRSASLYLGCLSLPPVASMIAIYPRDHYAITLAPALAIFTLQLLEPWRWLKPTPAGALLTAAALLGCLAFSWHYDRGHFAHERFQLTRIAFAREVDRAAPDADPLVMDMDGDLTPFVPHPRASLASYLWPADWRSFKTWALAHRPAWISYDDQLVARYGVSQAVFEDFARHDLGYTMHVCPQDRKLILFTHP